MAWWAWMIAGLVLWCCVAIALAPVVGQLLKWAAASPGGHRADPAGFGLTLDVYEAVVPVAEVAGRPPWLEGLPDWAAPEADRVTLYGGASGSLGSDYTLPPAQEATLRRELHHVDGYEPPERLCDPGQPHEKPAGTESAGSGCGAGDESEGYGLTAPPASLDPMRPSLALARCDAFIMAMRADHAVWLADARERWAAA